MQESKGIHTQQEILSQPETWANTLQFLKESWTNKLPDPRDYNQIIVSGCGSTYYFSLWAARFLHLRLGIPSIALPGSELWYSGEEWIKPFKKILLISVSRSGKTTETLHALDLFMNSGRGDALAITCYADSPLAKKAPLSVNTTAGMEKSIAQTRSFSNMMLPLIFLAERSISENLISTMQSCAQTMLDIYQAQARKLGNDTSIERFFFLGDGPLYGLAQEVMLKMKEMSLSYSEAFHFLEFRHGPMSMVNEHSLVVGFTDQKRTSFENPVFADMKNLGAQILAVGDEEASLNCDHCFSIDPTLPDSWKYPLYLPLIQLIAYERSLSKGLNPDKPENLTAVVEL